MVQIGCNENIFPFQDHQDLEEVSRRSCVVSVCSEILMMQLGKAFSHLGLTSI